LDGTDVSLAAWAGKVVMVVNTASECGYTPQYAGLQALHTKYEARGFAVLGFPSNDFGGQEPGSAAQIAAFCSKNFGVTFPMFEKIQVKGSGRAPLYTLLAEAKGEPKWNFHKYLIDKKGRPVEGWPSSLEPSSMEIARAIERELALP
jgi:glutathione peroxidase